VREQERQEQRNEELAEIAPKIPEGITLIQGDFATASIAPNSIQLIMTDPPYPEEYLPEWDKLSDFASKVLVPGGYLITYCGHFHIPYVINTLKRNLEYFWIIALAQPEEHALVHSRHVFCNWKPILIFYKPPLALPGYFGDLVTCDKKEKAHHEWQQGLPAFEKLIENFCPKNGVIIDPFAGSGTTIIAAKRLGRKVVGIEIKPETFAIMQKRVSEETINDF
jgi:site-specific DNA-methyltransferase (adenine-specific)